MDISAEEICANLNMCGDEFEDFEINHEKIINEINNMKTSWYAAPNAKFMKSKASDVRKTLGTIVDSDWIKKLPRKQSSPNVEVPDTFDCRSNWASCPEMALVRD